MYSQVNTFQQLIEGDLPVLVDFYADWCGPCKQMNPILEETSKLLGKKVKVIKVNVDRNSSAANKFQVRGVPTLILFHQGKILWRHSGTLATSQLVHTVEKNLISNH